MAKKKKQKKPNIPVQTIARSRLDKILAEYYNGELDEDECVASIRALMEEAGNEPVLNSLIGMLDNANAEQTDALMVTLSRLGNEQTIQHLWRLVRRSKMSVGGKMTALVILKQMGEDVDLDNPGEYFPWRDIKKTDVGEVAQMGRVGLQGIIKELQKIRNVDDAEVMMMQFDTIFDKTGGAEITQSIVDDLVAMGDSGAADLLAAISATTHDPEKRKAARTGLLRLSGQKIFPQSEIVKSILDERFFAAYCTDPAHPWQQQVILTFERGKNQVQSLVFLLDFGRPWKGAIKDFWPSQSMTSQKFQREFLDGVGAHDIEQRRVPYARARKFILDAMEANRKNKIKLPESYEKYRYLLERRIIDPSPGTLAYTQQVDARTEDEWGELKGDPIRGMQIITGLAGTKRPVVLLDDLDDLDDFDYS